MEAGSVFAVQTEPKCYIDTGICKVTMKEVASLRYGVIFKKAFSDPDIFTAFVEDFVGTRMEIERVETEKSFDPPIGRVDIKFDLFAQDLQNRIVVDIQHERFSDHYAVKGGYRIR